MLAKRCLLLLALWLLPILGPSAWADWPQWRGPNRDGHVSPTPAWPETLDHLDQLWRVPLGKGYSSPIVTGDHVFVSETLDDSTEGARAFDRRNGREIWNVSWPGEGKVPFFAAKNGDWIRSTPAWDGSTLFVGGMNEVLRALDGATGNERWKVDLPARFEVSVPDFGFASSPLVEGQYLYVQAANSVVKLATSDGSTVWRSLISQGAIGVSGAFSSPVLAEIGGRSQLIVQTRESLHGLDPSSGDILWSQEVPHFRGMNILTPMVLGNQIFTSSYRNRSFLYDLQTLESGELTTETAWTHKAQAYMSSPILIEDHLYLHLGNGRLICLDAKTGVSPWTSTPLGKYWSMVSQGRSILALNETGELHLIRANPKTFQLLATRSISDQETWGHLAVSGRDLFVRELKAIAVYRWSEDSEESPKATGSKAGTIKPLVSSGDF